MSTENTDSDRKKHLVRIARISVGIVFILLGIIGSLLPIMQGWIFFLLALITFFPAHPRVARILDKAEPKFPRMVSWLKKLGIGVDIDEPDGDSRREDDRDEVD